MNSRHLLWVCVVVTLAAFVSGACGGGGAAAGSPSPSPAPAPAPSPSPAPSGTIFTITTSGVSPKSIVVSPGTRVTFINNDTVAHDMSSDPHPDHVDCPEINQVGFLTPGQSRQTGNLNTIRTCGFHDHNQPLNASLAGRIVIQ